MVYVLNSHVAVGNMHVRLTRNFFFNDHYFYCKYSWTIALWSLTGARTLAHWTLAHWTLAHRNLAHQTLAHLILQTVFGYNS